ncbi:MAG: hypothetical protein ACYTEZ_19135 [Planctomycetota bacterium]|jgi:hypothetical protein
MIANLVILLLAAAASAYGAALVVKRRPPWWAAIPALLLYVVCGIHAVLLAWFTSAGIVLPGLQLSPGLKGFYLAEVWRGRFWGLEPALLGLVVAAHLLVAAPKITLDRLKAPLPATVVFLGLFLLFRARGSEPPIAFDRTPGPAHMAYLTTEPVGEGARIILAHGEPGASFLDVAHVHESASKPEPIKILWTKDGTAIVFSIHHFPYMAIDLDGETTGELPVESHEWPKPDGGYTSPDVRRRFSQARRDVAEYIGRHGGIFVPPKPPK